jgi:hypothetical protein
MKQIGTWIGLLLALSVGTAANAMSVQYQLTATHTQELVWNGSQNVPAGSGFLFADGTPVSVSFSYDAATPATSTNNVGVSDLSSYGHNSYYTGSLTGISGSVLGYSFSSGHGDTVVADSSFSDPTSSDGIFHQTGRFANSGSPAFSSLSGFSIGDFTLIGVAAYIVGPKTLFPDQSLPTTLSGAGAANTGVNLLFVNSTGAYRTAQFWNGTIAPVPLPAAFLFFASGLAGLGANAFRKAKR